MAIKKQCAFCHAILFEDDDVVFCPECGAAHHRECYNSLGHCARANLHGTPEAEVDYSEPEQEESREEQAEPFGFDNGPQGDQPPFTVFGSFQDVCGGVDPQSEIEGKTVTDVASFVRINTKRYVPKFQELSTRRTKTDWNWGGFIFSYGWLSFRKCHLQSLITALFTLLAYVMMSPLMAHFYSALFPYYQMTQQERYSNYAVINEAMMTAYQTATPMAWVLCVLGVLLIIGIHVFIGLRGDRIYMSHVFQKIDKINSDENVSNKLQKLMASGGINPFSAYIVINVMNLVFSYLIGLFLL